MESHSVLLASVLSFMMVDASAHSSAPATPQAAHLPVNVQTFRYATGASRSQPEGIPLMLDLYVPRTCRPACPAIVAVHGGSFRTGARDLDEQREYGLALAERGVAVASITYRLQGDSPIVRSPFLAFAETVRRADYQPTQRAVAIRGPEFPIAVAAAVADTSAAIAWLKRHGRRHGIDPSRIGLLGASAGAMTVLNLAYLSDDNGAPPQQLKAVVSVRGMLIDDRSPAASRPLRKGDPPLFIVHGTADDRVPFSEANRLFHMASCAELSVRLHPIGGYGHELGGNQMLQTQLDDGSRVIDRLSQFLSQAFSGRSDLRSSDCVPAKATCPGPDQ